MVTYNMELGIQLFHKAAQQLEYLLQLPELKTDYGMALALVFLAWQVALLQEEHSREEFQRYLTGCLHICYELRAFHSDAFVRCLYLLASLPHCVHDKCSIHLRLNELEAYPYHALTKDVTPITERNAVSSTDRTSQRQLMTYSMLQQRMPLSQKTLCHIIAGMCLLSSRIFSCTLTHVHSHSPSPLCLLPHQLCLCGVRWLR